MKIKNMNEILKPREKLIKNGVKSLTDEELLAILINTGNKNESCIEIASKILNDLTNISDLLNLTFESLIKYDGIKEKKASTIIASFELARRMLYYEKKLVTVTNSNEVYQMLRPKILGIDYEKLFVLYLNNRCQIIKVFEQEGDISETFVNKRQLLKDALNLNAKFVILAHNHPGGDNKPSQSDIKTTKELNIAFSYMNIKLIDHIILTQNSFFSFLEEKKL